MAEEPPPFQSSKLQDVLKIHLNQNDTLTRSYDVVPSVPPSPTPPTDPNSNPIHALSKDIPLNPTTNTSLRLFLPHPPPPPSVKLPVILYFHGGGFILFHASSIVFHDSCSAFASLFPAIVASVEYRLAPEDRLPAAYDDAVDAINWMRNQALDPTKSEPWIREHADFNNCFLMGCSAGGNITYFADSRGLVCKLTNILEDPLQQGRHLSSLMEKSSFVHHMFSTHHTLLDLLHAATINKQRRKLTSIHALCVQFLFYGFYFSFPALHFLETI
ncbi:PREDICTED: probable carboxylesterase 8 isoform X2 [Lupinus angustifolius]|uniref:probable carboxylesterase 8 isoform X2 n=1 Tax=Lupinus angustifolius TaxID=3871 RepID=UPI00092F856E|nr:PREDICTED: probable carboxylesterase 8 isoform X2 [Lupinus angustifolius]